MQQQEQDFMGYNTSPYNITNAVGGGNYLSGIVATGGFAELVQAAQPQLLI